MLFFHRESGVKFVFTLAGKFKACLYADIRGKHGIERIGILFRRYSAFGVKMSDLRSCVYAAVGPAGGMGKKLLSGKLAYSL